MKKALMDSQYYSSTFVGHGPQQLKQLSSRKQPFQNQNQGWKAVKQGDILSETGSVDQRRMVFAEEVCWVFSLTVTKWKGKLVQSKFLLL